MNHYTKTVISALAILLLLAGGAATKNLNRQIYSPGDSRDRACRSDEIIEYLLRHDILPLSQELQERLLAESTPVVRVIYLVPSDRQPRPEAPIALTNGIKHLQRWYSEQMGDGETFKLHNPIVETIRSSHDASWFSTNPAGDNPSLYLWFNSVNEASARFFDPNNTYIIYVDVEAPGQAVGGAGGVALLPQHDVLGMIGQNASEPKVCRWVGGLGHELGHALGLPHPPECDSHQSPDNSFPCQSLMYLGYLVYPDTYLLSDNKDKLSQSAFIVPLQLDDQPSGCSNLLTSIPGPSISSLDFDGKKKLTIVGTKLGGAPRLLINNADRTDFMTSVSDTMIRVKGKSKKLGLKGGDNTVQVYDSNGAGSNIYILRL